MEDQDRRGQGRLRRAGRAARGPGRPARRRRGAGGRQDARAGRAPALLAERVRSAYDTDRTSLLETFLSGGTFTDLLAEMSYYIDVGEQDKALANQIATTRRPSPRSTRRPRTRAPGRTSCARRRPPRSGALDRSLADLKARQGRRSSKLEKRTAQSAGRPEADLSPPWPAQQGDARRGSSPRRQPRRRSSRRDRRAHPQAGAAAATSRRSTTGRCSWPMDAATSRRTSAAAAFA